MDLPLSTIRATVLIETILAAFEMDEILYELRAHSAGLNSRTTQHHPAAPRNISHKGRRECTERSLDSPAVRCVAVVCQVVVGTICSV